MGFSESEKDLKRRSLDDLIASKARREVLLNKNDVVTNHYWPRVQIGASLIEGTVNWLGNPIDLKNYADWISGEKYDEDGNKTGLGLHHFERPLKRIYDLQQSNMSNNPYADLAQLGMQSIAKYALINKNQNNTEYDDVRDSQRQARHNKNDTTPTTTFNPQFESNSTVEKPPVPPRTREHVLTPNDSVSHIHQPKQTNQNNFKIIGQQMNSESKISEEGTEYLNAAESIIF